MDHVQGQSRKDLSLVQLAIDYLILEDDAESDADSALGFDDDAQVFNAIARLLGRSNLCLPDVS